jgi:hypothetical protein
MMKKFRWVCVATVLATGFASPALAQSFAFSGSEAKALSAYYDGQQLWDYAPASRGGLTATRTNGRKLYDMAPDVQSQTCWPSAAAMGSSR